MEARPPEDVSNLHDHCSRIIFERLLIMEEQRTVNTSSYLRAAGFCLLCIAASTLQAGVDDLAWMTGSWAGPAGPEQTLEENWTAPADGSIGALVRMRGRGATSMVELIVIEEEGNGLTLHIQQWDPGFNPRPGGAQKMVLVAMGEQTVTFEAVTEGGLLGLTYTRPREDTFTIDVTRADGTVIALELKAL